MVLPRLLVSLLGRFEMRRGMMPLTDRFKPRLRTLIAYLLLHGTTPLSRQQVAFQFWPDSTDTQARANLRKIIYRLRQAFPEVDDYLELDGSFLSWRDGDALWLDVAEFEAALKEGAEAGLLQKVTSLQKAITLYKGDLLPDLYDDWVLEAREHLRQRYLHALQVLARLHEEQRDYGSASSLVGRLLREDPLQEAACRHLMRLQALSGDVPGALRTYHRCARQLEQELGVKPGARMQQAYGHLLNRREPLPPETSLHAPRQLPLVGQDKAWLQLRERWGRAAAGYPQAVVILGETGMGKTRLAEELLHWAGRQGFPTLKAACFATDTPLPLHPIADWLRSDAVGRVLPDLEPHWRREVARVLPELLASDATLKMPRPLTEAWQQQHLFMALAQAVTAAGEPLLLFLDDLQWADADTLSWLHFLAQQKGNHRFLLLATVRSEEVRRGHPLPLWRETLARALPVAEIGLGPLGAAATAALATHYLGKALDEAAAVALYKETEGNPLFTVEMMHAGFPQREMPLPEKVRSVIEIRLNRLTPQAREVAELAAVIGRRFDFQTLAAASPKEDEEVLSGLDQLWQQQIVREQGGDGYDFSHDKIRQVALLQLSPVKRRWWHRQVAEGLEQFPEPELERLHGQIAAQWGAAGQPEKAVVHYLRAAQMAVRLYAHMEVVLYLQRALALLPADDVRRTDICTRIGEALLTGGRFDEAASTFQEAADRSVDIVQRTRLLARRVRSQSGGRQFEKAKNTYRQALALFEAAPGAASDEEMWRAWIDLHLSLLNTLYFANESDEMEAVCRSMVEPVEAYGTARQHTRYLTSVSRMRSRLLRYRMTDEEVEERRLALRWARTTADDDLITDNQCGLGFILLWAGRSEEAIDELQQAAAQAEALGHVPLQSRSLAYLGIAYRMSGDPAGTRETIEKLVPVAHTEENTIYLGVAKALLAWLKWQDGDVGETERHSRSALQRWQEARGPPYPMQWLARFPLLAVTLTRAESTSHLADAQMQARAILDRSQQRLSDELTGALERAVAADARASITRRLQEVCHLAQEQGLL